MKEVIQRSKYRVYLNKSQESIFADTVGCARFVWNKRVENFNNNSCEKDLSIKELKEVYPFLEKFLTTL